MSDHLDSFSPFESNGSVTVRSLQGFSELALALMLLTRWFRAAAHAFDGIGVNADVLARWSGFVSGWCADSAYEELALAAPQRAYAYLTPYIALRSTGIEIPTQEEALRHQRECRLWEVQEVLPFRALERAYLGHAAGILPEPAWPGLIARTWLGGAGDLLHADDEACVSLTHTAWYGSNFGDVPWRGSIIQKDRLGGLLEALLVHYLRLGDWDLLVEVLLAQATLGPKTATGRLADAVLGRAHDPGGGLVASEGLRQSLSVDGARADPDHDFQAYRHSTVLSLLYAVRLTVP